MYNRSDYLSKTQFDTFLCYIFVNFWNFFSPWDVKRTRCFICFAMKIQKRCIRKLEHEIQWINNSRNWPGNLHVHEIFHFVREFSCSIFHEHGVIQLCWEIPMLCFSCRYPYWISFDKTSTRHAHVHNLMRIGNSIFGEYSCSIFHAHEKVNFVA